jgi:hypothetical protein
VSDVRVGQVWADNDKRMGHDRTGEVVMVSESHAFVLWSTGLKTRVKLSRFRPNSTGYRLVKDAP